MDAEGRRSGCSVERARRADEKRSKASFRHPEKGEPRSGDPGLGFSLHQVAIIEAPSMTRRMGYRCLKAGKGSAQAGTQRGLGAGALGERLRWTSVWAAGAR